MTVLVTPLAFRALRLLSDGELHSGAALAQALAASRAQLNHALKGLSEVGVKLSVIRGRGYRWEAPIDWLDAAELERLLGRYASKYRVQLVDSIESTNTTLLQQAASGIPSGSVLAAELQTKGRGRRGRTWHTGLGGALTFSSLWRFDQGAGFLAGLGLAVGVALVRALSLIGVQDAKLKWPNDVLVNHQKLAGTLVEIQGDVQGPSLAVVGVGMNVRLDPATRHRIDQAVTDLATVGAPCDRNRALAHVLTQLADVFAAFSVRGFGPLRKEWESYHVYAGRHVTLRHPDGSTSEGTVTGVSDDGALLLQTPAGLRRFHSGEVSLRATGGDQHARSVSSR